MHIHLLCCRLIRHRKFIYVSFFFSFILSLIYVIIIPLIFKFLQVSTTNKSFSTQQYIVPRDYPVFKTITYCSFYNCFNIYKCSHKLDGSFKVYVYPAAKYVDHVGISVGGKMSREYQSILNTIINSHYYTNKPAEACVFIPSIDTLNQNQYRAKETSQALGMLPYWNEGLNHIIFNMVPANAPESKTLSDLSIGKAIVAGFGFNTWTYRPSFDISIGIYSKKASQLSINYRFTYRSIFITTTQTNLHPVFMAQLKYIEQGKNLLRVLEKCSNTINNRSLVCYGNNTYDYPNIFIDSTYCLILPGSRQIDISLMYALASGCIPIVAINDVVLPFFEVIDWKRAVILWNENELHTLIDNISGIPLDRRKEMSAQCQWLYYTYLSSLQKITMTTLKIMSQRLHPHTANFYEDWNMRPNPDSARNPLFLPYMSDSFGFTAVILTYDRIDSLFKLIDMVKGAPSLEKIIIVWNNQYKSPPHFSAWPKTRVPLKIVKTSANKLSNRFYPYKEIETEAVLSLDDDILMLTIDEIEFGFKVWREFSDQIVGFPSRTHVWNNKTNSWKYESEWRNEISMILTGAAFYHKYWNHAYTYIMPNKVKKMVDDQMNCEDIAMNFLVSNTTNKGPIKVTPKKKFKCPQCKNTEMLSVDEGHMAVRTSCINKFTKIFGRMPLKAVEYRADPVLYRDILPKKLKRYNNIGDL
ncbi:exostosin-2 [Daktulosphaira vitifoliae]|uniref:exostosin-2 n=1 Tax=Daktulosphaira vitifoliae TaxID=58002 RepID=UPI0021A9C8BC|nr:exostosin-2 [Daktulosphaira vitifoliae]